MGERPASDPPKPGSKLADIRRMRDLKQGGIRSGKGVEPVQPASASENAQARPIAPKRVLTRPATEPPVASNAPRKSVKKAKTILKKAEAKAKAGRPPAKGPKPWEALGLKRRTYFNRKKAGNL
jgi:hypothetical protein